METGSQHMAIFLGGFVVYIIAMIWIGVHFSRGKRSGKDYITGGNSLSFLLIFGTMGATLIGTGSSIGATANGFKFGWGGAAYGLGAALGVFALAWLAHHTKLRQKNFVTMAEEAQFHYNGNLTIKYLMAVMMYLVEIVWLGNHINGGATYLSFVSGLDLFWAKVFTVFGIGIYVIIGGYLAVVWTDTIQLVLLLLGFVAITAIAVPMAGGVDGISSAIIDGGKEGNLSLYGVDTMGLMALVSLTFSILIPCFGTPTYRIRVYTAKDSKSAVKGLTMSGSMLFIFSFLPAIIGMSAYAIAMHSGAEYVIKNPDFAFTYIATVILGPVLGLCFLIAGLSATMSSASSDAIAGVGILVQDIYPMFTGKELSAKAAGVVSRVLTIMTLFFAFVACLFAKDVMSYITNVIGSIIPGVSVAMVYGALYRKASWQSGVASIVSGLIFGISFLFIDSFQAYIKATFSGPAIPATIVALACAVVVGLFTSQEKLSEEDRLKLVYESRGEQEKI